MDPQFFHLRIQGRSLQAKGFGRVAFSGDAPTDPLPGLRELTYSFQGRIWARGGAEKSVAEKMKPRQLGPLLNGGRILGLILAPKRLLSLAGEG
jgi:hypothetical protein